MLTLFCSIFYSQNYYTNIFQQPTQTPPFACSFIAPFCLPWQHRGTENIYNGCRTNAAAEASYDRTRSSALQFAALSVSSITGETGHEIYRRTDRQLLHTDHVRCFQAKIKIAVRNKTANNQSRHLANVDKTTGPMQNVVLCAAA